MNDVGTYQPVQDGVMRLSKQLGENNPLTGKYLYYVFQDANSTPNHRILLRCSVIDGSYGLIWPAGPRLLLYRTTPYLQVETGMLSSGPKSSVYTLATVEHQ